MNCFAKEKKMVRTYFIKTFWNKFCWKSCKNIKGIIYLEKFTWKRNNNTAACGWCSDMPSTYTVFRLCIEIMDTLYITFVRCSPLSISFPYDWSIRYDFMDWRPVLLEKGQETSVHDFFNSLILLLTTSALIHWS